MSIIDEYLTNAFLAFCAILVVRKLLIVFLVLISQRNKMRFDEAVFDKLPHSGLHKLTILIPTFQEEMIIESTLNSIRPMINAGAHLIIVDDGSSDNTPAIIHSVTSSFSQVSVIRHQKNCGKAAALNTGLGAVRTPLVLTQDADTLVPIESIFLAIEVMEQRLAKGHNISSIAFDISIFPSDDMLSELQGIEYDGALNFERCAQSVVSAISVSPGAASLWCVRDLVRYGGFSNDTVTEDVDVTLRLASLGHCAVHVLGCQGYTLASRTLGDLINQRTRWCLGHYQNIPRHLLSFGKNVVFSFLTLPNFIFLSVVQPISFIFIVWIIFLENSFYWGVIFSFTLLWLSLVYAQRFIALNFFIRRFRFSKFFLEPFFTSVVHIISSILAINLIIRRVLGRRENIWARRASR